jgi:hypothetical protein
MRISISFCARTMKISALFIVLNTSGVIQFDVVTQSVAKQAMARIPMILQWRRRRSMVWVLSGSSDCPLANIARLCGEEPNFT